MRVFFELSISSVYDVKLYEYSFLSVFRFIIKRLIKFCFQKNSRKTGNLDAPNNKIINPKLSVVINGITIIGLFIRVVSSLTGINPIIIAEIIINAPKNINFNLFFIIPLDNLIRLSWKIRKNRKSIDIKIIAK
ncbi:unnamed protein product [marine sediment metagenome]|uniref:Uncharacterized protein n=1 Tax=marine sediment metagenome TaxID=412755 RepID=X0ZU26_9ZZZZ